MERETGRRERERQEGEMERASCEPLPPSLPRQILSSRRRTQGGFQCSHLSALEPACSPDSAGSPALLHCSALPSAPRHRRAPAARCLVPGAETPGGGIGRPGTRDASRALPRSQAAAARVLMAAAHSRPP